MYGALDTKVGAKIVGTHPLHLFIDHFFSSKLTLILQYKPETCELKARKGDKVRVHYRVRVWYSCKFVFIIEFIIVKWYLVTKCNSSAWICLILSIK